LEDLVIDGKVLLKFVLSKLAEHEIDSSGSGQGTVSAFVHMGTSLM
jgi:hypothetical protein